MTLPPDLPDLDLANLAPGFAGDLGPRETPDGLSFTDLDLDAPDVDLTGAHLTDCSIQRARGSRFRLRAATAAGCRLTHVDVPALDGSRVVVRNTLWSDSRLGSAELFESTWRVAHFRDCKLGYLNLRGADVQNLTFTDCTIEEIDLTEARVQRLAFPGSTLAALTTTRARLEDVDLRGLTLRRLDGIDGLRGSIVDEQQLLELAPHLAGHLGIQVR